MMKYLIPISLALFFCTSSYCQSNVISELQKICPVNLGDSIKVLNDLVSCAQASRVHQPYSDTSGCIAYSYLPPQKVPLKLGDVGFSHVNINMGKDKKIISVLFIKDYITTDTLSMESRVRKDYNNLCEFFETYFHSKGEKHQTYKTELFKLKGIGWKRAGYRLEIQKNQSKWKDGKKWSGISVWIEPTRPRN